MAYFKGSDPMSRALDAGKKATYQQIAGRAHKTLAASRAKGAGGGQVKRMAKGSSMKGRSLGRDQSAAAKKAWATRRGGG